MDVITPLADPLIAIETRATAMPDASAVRDGTGDWTYRQFWNAVDRIGRVVLASGTDPGRPVALHLDKGAVLIAAMVAVVRCGRFFVVVDPVYPAARNRLVLEDADPSLVLHDAGPPDLPDGVACLALPAMAALSQPADGPAPPVPAGAPDDIACLVYTSGSTGRPKGVMVPSAGLAQIARVQASCIGIGPGTRLSMLGSGSVFAGLRTVWGALPAGARIATYSIESRGLDALQAWLAEERVEVLHCTPAVLRHFARTLPPGERLHCVRRLILGADRVLAEDVSQARAIFDTDVRVWTGLGASETGTVSGALVGPDEALPDGAMPLGEAVAGRRVLLLDDDGSIVPDGQTGELVVEGRDIALGYWRQPERTATVFGPGSSPGWRRYRTGDLARRVPGGSLLHMGRRDFVVKVRGVRVDLGEVEAVLAEHPAVRECAIVAHPQPDGDLLLVAFVEFAEPLPTQSLRDHLESRLPAAMWPQRYVTVAEWPKTLSGKLDRRALQQRLAADLPPPAEAAAVTPPADDLERLVARIWSEVLGLAVADRHAHFLELGGNSLSAMRATARVAAALGRSLAPTALLRSPRLADFAAVLRDGATTANSAPAAAPAESPALEQAPLSPAQEALWLIGQNDGPSATYNLSLSIRLDGPVDVPLLAAALAALQRRHEALRLRIDAGQDAQLLQRLVPPADTADFETALAPRDQPDEAALSAALAAEAAEPVGLDAVPLWRARLFRQGDRRHVLVLVLHHIICDGWSVQRLASELGALYSGRSLEPLAPEASFLAAAAAQQRRTSLPSFAAALARWRERLKDVANIALPFDRKPGPDGTGAGAVLRVPLPGDVAAGLAALAAAGGYTPLVAHIALFQLLLVRHAGPTPFGLGLPAAERADPRLDGTVGYLVNSLVLRSEVPAGMPFSRLVATAHAVLMDALEDGEVPFERLVRELSPQREAGRNPLFQVAIALQDPPRRQPEFAGLDCALLDVHNGASKFDLTLEIGADGDAPWLEFEYCRDLFDAVTIEALARRYLLLARAVLAAPDAEALTLPLQDPVDRQLLDRWNDTVVPVAEPRTLDGLVLAQCARTPDAVAITSPDGSVLYRELAMRIRELAAALRGAGLRDEEAVGVQMPRGVDSIIAALAVLHAGGAYVPLDPDWPRPRVERIVETAGIRRVLRGPGDLRELQATVAGDASRPRPAADSLAYVLFTSGSTGEPKGVEVEHGSLANHVAWFRRVTGLGGGDAVLFKTSPTFDASLAEMFAPLACGARVVVAADASDLDPERLLATVRDHGVTLLQSVPSAARALVATGRLPDCTALRWLVVGGEALDAGLARALRAALPGARIGNFYGPTETTIDATYFEIGRDVPDVLPIGRPVDNLRCHVLDASGREQPVGVWGDLHVAGAGVARGYARRPDLTAAAFRPDPFVAGARMYRTGDRARWRHDGQLEFAGRDDGQVKLRGLRIELGEIEQALRALPDVADAVVLVAQSAQRAPFLAAAAVPARRPWPDERELRVGLAERLPRYMVPARILLRDSLPLLPSGKVDRAALVAAALADDAASADAAPPDSPRERDLLQLWRELLDAPVAGIDDDFFERGGHSLLAARLVARARDELGLALTLPMVFRHPTIRGLAAAAEAGPSRQGGAELIPLQASGTRAPVYCICGVQLYQRLATALGPDIPVHGVFIPWEEQILDPAVEGAPALPVEALARAYLDTISAHQPDGPFSLVGFSFGGVLAYEVARLARAAGRTVSLTVILDMPTVEARRRASSARLLRKTLRPVLGWLTSLPGLSNAERTAARPRDRREALYDLAMAGYRTPRTGGPLVVVRRSARGWSDADPERSLGWDAYCPDVRCLEVPAADHLAILEPGAVPVIAQRLRAWLP